VFAGLPAPNARSKRKTAPPPGPRRPVANLVPFAIVSHTIQSGSRDPMDEHWRAMRAEKRITVMAVCRVVFMEPGRVGREARPGFGCKSTR
jgi:hypothetical protein